MIQLKKIDKYYDSRFQRTFILKGVNLEVKQGEFCFNNGAQWRRKINLAEYCRIT